MDDRVSMGQTKSIASLEGIDTASRSSAQPTTSMPSMAIIQPVTERKHLPFPPEIRNRIYKEALSYDFGVGGVPVSMFCWTPAQQIGASLLALLLVSKTTFAEAYHIFYNLNKIVFGDTKTLFIFLKRIGNLRRQEVCHVSFDWAGQCANEAFHLLKSCRKLRTLEIKIPSKVLMPFEGYEMLGQIRGLENVIIDMRRHWLRRYRGVASYSGAWHESTWNNYLHGLRAKLLTEKRNRHSAVSKRIDSRNGRHETSAVRAR